jgi:hypothetical protein
MRGLTVAALLLAFTATAQEWPFELWHQGKVVLVSGDTLRGLVKYDLQQDLIQFNDKKNKIEAYTARKVLYFEIFDVTVNAYRNFFALPFAATPGYNTMVFFELLEEGKLTLLVREALEYRTFSSPYYFGSYSRYVMIYRYFMMNNDGDITEFKGKRAELMALMSNKADQVDKYIRANRLKIEEKNDFMKVIAYYNSLFEPSN